jgi:hypothetical protein
MKYKHLKTKEEVIVIDRIAAGVCYETMGGTFIIFKDNEDAKYHKIMRDVRFYQNYEEKI